MLFFLRTMPPVQNQWYSIGGRFLKNEPLRVAAVRKLREETKLSVAPSELVLREASALPDIAGSAACAADSETRRRAWTRGTLPRRPGCRRRSRLLVLGCAPLPGCVPLPAESAQTIDYRPLSLRLRRPRLRRPRLRRSQLSRVESRVG